MAQAQVGQDPLFHALHATPRGMLDEIDSDSSTVVGSKDSSTLINSTPDRGTPGPPDDGPGELGLPLGAQRKRRARSSSEVSLSQVLDDFMKTRRLSGAGSREASSPSSTNLETEVSVDLDDALGCWCCCPTSLPDPVRSMSGPEPLKSGSAAITWWDGQVARAHRRVRSSRPMPLCLKIHSHIILCADAVMSTLVLSFRFVFGLWEKYIPKSFWTLCEFASAALGMADVVFDVLVAHAYLMGAASHHGWVSFVVGCTIIAFILLPIIVTGAFLTSARIHIFSRDCSKQLRGALNDAPDTHDFFEDTPWLERMWLNTVLLLCRHSYQFEDMCMDLYDARVASCRKVQVQLEQLYQRAGQLQRCALSHQQIDGIPLWRFVVWVHERDRLLSLVWPPARKISTIQFRYVAARHLDKQLKVRAAVVPAFLILVLTAFLLDVVYYASAVVPALLKLLSIEKLMHQYRAFRPPLEAICESSPQALVQLLALMVLQEEISPLTIASLATSAMMPCFQLIILYRTSLLHKLTFTQHIRSLLDLDPHRVPLEAIHRDACGSELAVSYKQEFSMALYDALQANTTIRGLFYHDPNPDSLGELIKVMDSRNVGGVGIPYDLTIVDMAPSMEQYVQLCIHVLNARHIKGVTLQGGDMPELPDRIHHKLRALLVQKLQRFSINLPNVRVCSKEEEHWFVERICTEVFRDQGYSTWVADSSTQEAPDSLSSTVVLTVDALNSPNGLNGMRKLSTYQMVFAQTRARISHAETLAADDWQQVLHANGDFQHLTLEGTLEPSCCESVLQQLRTHSRLGYLALSARGSTSWQSLGSLATLCDLKLRTQGLVNDDCSAEGVLANAITKLSQLTYLELQGLCAADMAALEAKAVERSLPALRHLAFVEGCFAPSSVPRVVANIQAIETLELERVWLGAEGVGQLAQTLTGMDRLRGLVLRGVRLGEQGATEILQSLQAAVVLDRLDLSNTGLRGDAVVALANLLTAATRVRELQLNGNKIGAAGMLILAPSLRGVCNLQLLDLGATDLGSAGVRSLCSALPELTTLRVLRLPHNDFASEGAQELSQVVRRLRSLEEMDLEDNRLCEGKMQSGTQNLLFALRHRINRVRRLNLSGNALIQALMTFFYNVYNTSPEGGLLSHRPEDLSQELSTYRHGQLDSVRTAAEGQGQYTTRASEDTPLPTPGAGEPQLVPIEASPFMLPSAPTSVRRPRSPKASPRPAGFAFRPGPAGPTCLPQKGHCPVPDGPACPPQKGPSPPTRMGARSPVMPRLDLEIVNRIREAALGSAMTKLNGAVGLARKLQTLNLAGSCLKDRGAVDLAAALGSLPELRLLNLRANDIGISGMQELAAKLTALSLLQELDIGENCFQGTGVRHLCPVLRNTRMKHLRVLAIDCSGVDSSGIVFFAAVLPKMPSLRVLRLGHNVAGYEGTDALRKALEKTRSQLEELEMDYLHLGGPVDTVTKLMQQLSRQVQLRKLVLSGNELEIPAVKALADTLPQLTSLQHLEVQDLQLNTDGMNVLLAALPATSQLECLRMQGMGRMRSTRSRTVLASASNIGWLPWQEQLWQSRDTLVELDLSGLGLGSSSLHAVAAPLRQLTTLTKLGLEGMGLREGGLCSALERLTRLEVLNVSRNSLTRAGACELAALLERLQLLRDLRFGSDHFGAEMLGQIARVLPKLPGMQNLVVLVARNVGLDALVEVLPRLEMLEEVWISSDGVSGAPPVLQLQRHTQAVVRQFVSDDG